MNVRVQLGLLIIVGLFATQVAHAQGYPPVHSGQQITPVGWHGGPHAPPQYCGPEQCDNTVYQLLPDDRGFLFDLDSRFDLSAFEVLRHSWVRAEWMNATIKRTRPALLGAQQLDPTGNELIKDPTKQFELGLPEPAALIPLSLPIPVQVASTKGIHWDDLMGVKGSFGIPLTKKSWVEGTFWGVEEGNEVIDVPRIPVTSPLGLGPFGLPSTVAVVMPLTTNGTPGNRVIDLTIPAQVNLDRVVVFDNSYFSRYDVKTWSSELNYVYDLYESTGGLTFSPLAGYRHTEYDETLAFGGTFDNSSGFLDFVDPLAPLGVLATPVSSSLSSSVTNFRNEFQFGFRSELPSKWVTVGVEPKVGLGLNLVRSQVTATNIRDAGDIGLVDPTLTTITDGGQTMKTRNRDLVFSSTLDLGLYANFHLTDSFNLRVGYNLIWMANMGVADQQIKYNENSVTVVDPVDPTISTTTSTADVVYKKGLKSRALEAFTIGGELILW